ncbi:MAG: T9SS type A sorting domain-containing protein [Bacteroidia bacterium]|nr:T9SS type A sorting domain-containing protein [Bacteroidia bacterium]
MKQLLSKVAVALFVLNALSGYSQQRLRYIQEVFEGVRVTPNVVYGSNIPYASSSPVDLKMDIYEPIGDTVSKRPLVILVHSGSFISPDITGTTYGRKTDSCMVELCKRFARRGWVAVSMDHRLGWNPLAASQEARSKGIMQAVWRSIQDGRACVRFFRANASTYRIDSDKITMGGSSSGAYVGIHVAYLNKSSETLLPKFLDGLGVPFIDTVALGGVEGNSGTPGYPSNIQLVFNFGGAVGDTVALEATDVPVISLHGVQDPTTPYGTAVVTTAGTGQPIIEVSGSLDLNKAAQRLGIQAPLINAGFNDQPAAGLYPLNGVGFEPWNWHSASSTVGVDSAKKYCDTLMSFFLPRSFKVLHLDSVMMDVVSGRQHEIAANTWSVFPNPANDKLYVSLEQEALTIQKIELIDISGKIVYSYYPEAHSQTQVIYRNNLPAGIYTLQIYTPSGVGTRKISFQ